MQDAHPLERAVGMAYYVSDAPGVGGQLRDDPEDFVVRELERVDAEPVDADPGGYPHLVVRVELRGWDTNDFAGALSDRLGISRERVSWAGTKDKHAITTQLFSVDGVSPDETVDAAGSLDGVTLDVVGRTGRPVLFGDLAGNDFEITVRDVERLDGVDAVTADLRAFAGGSDSTTAQDGGGADPESSRTSDREDPARVAVPNYFGQQRFGTARAVTHEVGLAIVRDDWEGAALAYVGNPSDREPEATREARAYVAETRDWAGAVERFPSALGYERAICQRLAENGASEPADFRDALEALPTNLQRLFVNAAQSFLFNRMLSRRLERGLPFDRPVAGDVVCFADRDAPAELPLPDADRTQRVTEDRLETVRRHCDRGRAFVTAPLVGTETTLGDGDPGEIERAVLDDAGVEPADFDRPGEFHSTGTRRAIAVTTDLATERVAEDAVSFSFALPKGSYATVVLREYLQTDPEALS